MKRPSAKDNVAIAADKVREALRPIASLIGKSEKARQKVAPGMWQHAMLEDNVRALRTAVTLMTGTFDDKARITRDELQASLSATAAMIGKTEKAKAMFAPGSSQYTLQRNRLSALRTAKATINAALAGRTSPGTKRRK